MCSPRNAPGWTPDVPQPTLSRGGEGFQDAASPRGFQWNKDQEKQLLADS
jgi:hypothetical protein